MKKKRLLSTAMAVALGMSTVAMGTFLPSSSQKASAEAALAKVKSSYGSSLDLGVANDERLAEMLKKQGKLAKDATPAEAEKAVNNYLQEMAKNAAKTKEEVPDFVKKYDNTLNKKLQDNGLKNGKGNKLGQTGDVASINKESWDGSVRDDKVLVLKIEFPDYQHNKITKDDTDMYYDDYSNEHYQNMIFGDNGYTGPNGENLISMKQYYEQQSGGSYTVNGTVAGWYTADHPAAYYGAHSKSGNDIRPRNLVYEALKKAAQDPSINLADYDKWDRYDLDGDGILNEPDGLIDHLMVIHSGVGEEAGGGALGDDAIWSHRWNLGGIAPIPGTKGPFNGMLGAYDYTIEPEDGAAGVMSHEFGHDLGLPDEYDTIYSGGGESIAYWSIMASGSWSGAIPGTEPSGFSPYAKEMLQSLHGGNWLSGTTLNADNITSDGTTVLLDEASSKGTNNDAVRIDLPDKKNVVNIPKEGNYEFASGRGDEIDHKMVTSLDLTKATNATLDYDVWYNTEENWDFGMVQVSNDGGSTWTSLSTPNTKSSLVDSGYPAIKDNLPGYTGSSNGWIHESVDLSKYAGQNIQLQFRYMTDWGTNLDGMYVDNVKVTADGNELLSDGAENDTSAFTFDGFAKDQGFTTSKHYYLLEWRSHNGVDAGLAHLRRGASLMSYDGGLVVWYVDEAFDNNWTGIHPGDGFLGVVDADQHTLVWSDKTVASTRYELHDAAFNTNQSDKMFVNYPGIFTLTDNFTQRTPLFDDSSDYSDVGYPAAGRNISEYGLKFRVVGQSNDGTVGKVLIFK